MDMTAKFIRLWIQLTPGNIDYKKLNDVCLETKVEQFKADVSKLIEVPDKCLDLLYCGKVLEDELSLHSYGIKAGSTVHVLKKREKDPPLPARVFTKEEIMEMANAYRGFNRNHRLRSALFRLIRQEVIDNIVITVPGLKEDTASMGFIRDPTLLLTMSNVDVVKRMAKTRPNIIEAANHIAAAVHEEASNTPSTSANTSGYSYSLDALSDDEEDSSQNRNFQSSDSLSRSNSTSRQRSFHITASQLAAALASASGAGFSNSPSANTSTAAGPSSSNSVITPEMFTQAIEQAIASVGTDRTLNTSLSNDSDVNMGNESENTSQSESESSSLASQMQQMRELGFTDIGVNLQALQASGGDLQAAVNLILSGVISTEEPHD